MKNQNLNEIDQMNPNKSLARMAGWLYLAMAITGAYGIMYVPSQIIIANDAAASAANIWSHETLYRMGILSQLICQIVFVYLVLALRKLFWEVNQSLAQQMFTLVVVSVPIAFVILLFQLASLVVLDDSAYLSSFQPEQLQALALAFFKLYEQGVLVVQIFWGLWLIPFGLLAYRSKFIPKAFGILLIVGGLGYVVASVTDLLFPSLKGSIDQVATIPSAVAEIAVILWLLIKGVRPIQTT